MTTRRGFLKGAGAAGIAFCGCGMLDAARAQQPGRRLPVTVNDKRVRTIDVHSHCIFHDAVNLMGNDARSVIAPLSLRALAMRGGTLAWPWGLVAASAFVWMTFDFLVELDR